MAYSLAIVHRIVFQHSLGLTVKLLDSLDPVHLFTLFTESSPNTASVDCLWPYDMNSYACMQNLSTRIFTLDLPIRKLVY